MRVDLHNLLEAVGVVHENIISTGQRQHIPSDGVLCLRALLAVTLKHLVQRVVQQIKDPETVLKPQGHLEAYWVDVHTDILAHCA